ncbi:MAG: hypothetical protein LCI00_15965 [Chloroflexi bacterium]|nr:hypothetical protein [Chloroflexota bacterium]MCC6892727.1 hypothetical protein [Anaerolineae bacterium]
MQPEKQFSTMGGISPMRGLANPAQNWALPLPKLLPNLLNTFNSQQHQHEVALKCGKSGDNNCNIFDIFNFCGGDIPLPMPP